MSSYKQKRDVKVQYDGVDTQFYSTQKNFGQKQCKDSLLYSQERQRRLELLEAQRIKQQHLIRSKVQQSLKERYDQLSQYQNQSQNLTGIKRSQTMLKVKLPQSPVITVSKNKQIEIEVKQPNVNELQRIRVQNEKIEKQLVQQSQQNNENKEKTVVVRKIFEDVKKSVQPTNKRPSSHQQSERKQQNYNSECSNNNKQDDHNKNQSEIMLQIEDRLLNFLSTEYRDESKKQQAEAPQFNNKKLLQMFTQQIITEPDLVQRVPEPVEQEIKQEENSTQIEEIETVTRRSKEEQKVVQEEAKVDIQSQPTPKSEDITRKKKELNRLIEQHVVPARKRQFERESKKRQAKQQLVVDGSSVKISLNFSTSFGEIDVIRRIIDKNNWSRSTGIDGDILWIEQTITSKVGQVYQNMTLSRIPGMRNMANKKMTSYFLNKVYEYFPTVFDFFPRTYNLPEDFFSFYNEFKERKDKMFIVKPDKGTQGYGIFIVKEIAQLFNNNNMDTKNLKKGLVVQEYIKSPLLIGNKKFDLRLYVLIASLNPLVVYLNDDGLARFCTEDYEPVTDQNSGNTFMHLTNYTLNKTSQGFVHHPENFMDINEATKRTFTSAKKSLHKMGIDVPKLKQRIEQVLIRFIYAMNPFLVEYLLINLIKQVNVKEIYQDRQGRCFHILGFDVLIDSDLKPWILEVNANPSLDITQEKYNQDGTKSVEISELDYYIKSRVIEDSFIIMMQSIDEQLKSVQRGCYFNSFKLIIDGRRAIENMDLFENHLSIFAYLSGHKFGPLNASKFCKLSAIQRLVNDECLKSDYDILFKKIMIKQNQIEMNFSTFIDAVELLAEKVFLIKIPNLQAPEKEINKLFQIKSSYVGYKSSHNIRGGIEEVLKLKMI